MAKNAKDGQKNVKVSTEFANLTDINQFVVIQQLEPLEIFTAFETKNKYIVKNGEGRKIFYAVEQSGCFSRQCWRSARPFTMAIMDNSRSTVITLNRPLGCNPFCFPCCPSRIYVSLDIGNAPTLIGTVVQTPSILRPTFDVRNASGEAVFRIRGPLSTCRICCDVEFKIMSEDGKKQIGKIEKKWSGLLKEQFTDADNFAITFPMELDVALKATLLGACFLIDFTYFQK